MIPYFGWTTFHVFGVPFQVWGTFVALGYALGTYIAWRRAKRLGLDANAILDLAFWIFLGSFIGARLLHVVAYDPAHYLAHPLDIINPWLPGFSMFGGFIGAALVFFYYCRRKALDWISYADTLIWGLPWGCGVGRIGCFLIHDHPGTLTHSVLGVRYPDGEVRHDHGLYLSLLGFATGLLFLWLNRHKRQPGFWFGTYMIIEGFSRFVLDFWRMIDVKYFGLTPTQYLSIPLIFAGIWLIKGQKLFKK